MCDVVFARNEIIIQRGPLLLKISLVYVTLCTVEFTIVDFNSGISPLTQRRGKNTQQFVA